MKAANEYQGPEPYIALSPHQLDRAKDFSIDPQMERTEGTPQRWTALVL
jgi:hypothetical protein